MAGNETGARLAGCGAIAAIVRVPNQRIYAKNDLLAMHILHGLFQRLLVFRLGDAFGSIGGLFRAVGGVVYRLWRCADLLIFFGFGLPASLLPHFVPAIIEKIVPRGDTRMEAASRRAVGPAWDISGSLSVEALLEEHPPHRAILRHCGKPKGSDWPSLPFADLTASQRRSQQNTCATRGQGVECTYYANAINWDRDYIGIDG